MEAREHWEQVCGTKAPDRVSWFRPHLETSLALIERAVPDRSASIIDVGGGAATLVDDLIARGYRNLTILDISIAALDVARTRLGETGKNVCWLDADATQTNLPVRSYDVWHDRAVFHFLTQPEDRLAYVRNVAAAVKPGGHVIVSTFGPEGPLKCSGLDVVRYAPTNSMMNSEDVSVWSKAQRRYTRRRSERRSSSCTATAFWTTRRIHRVRLSVRRHTRHSHPAARVRFR